MSLSKNTQENASHTQGWVTARPLENYSSMHELSLTDLIGWKFAWPQKHFFVAFNFNLHTPLQFHPQAYLTFQTCDEDKPPSHPNCCFSINEFKRWRIDISSYSSFNQYVRSLIRWHRCNYTKSEKTFRNYGCEVTLIEEDWTRHVDTVYRLYNKVALRHTDKLYDLKFFQEAAKRNDYKLLCAWYEGEMIGMFLLQDEMPTLHSTCCGFDYDHSSASYAYTWLHYALIQRAIEAKKYQFVDIGLTADESKKAIGFKSIPARMDIYANGFITRGLLRAASSLVTATITPDSSLKLRLRFGKK
jgi:hypothetical protein